MMNPVLFLHILLGYMMFPCSAPRPEPPAESQSAQAESAEDGDENCKLSMSEKLALFNKLSLPGRQDDGHADGPPERRRQKGSRYRTQPITVEEVNLVSVKSKTDQVKVYLNY